MSSPLAASLGPKVQAPAVTKAPKRRRRCSFCGWRAASAGGVTLRQRLVDRGPGSVDQRRLCEADLFGDFAKVAGQSSPPFHQGDAAERAGDIQAQIDVRDYQIAVDAARDKLGPRKRRSSGSGSRPSRRAR